MSMFLLLAAAAAGAIFDASSLPILWPGPDLYPANRLAAKEGGTTTIEFYVLPNGVVTNCTVIQSSGFDDLDFDDLDDASCSLALGRQSFAPREGTDLIPMREAVRWAPSKSERSEWNGAIPISPETWVTPADYPPTALQAEHQGTVQVQFDVLESGAAQNCKVVASSGDLALDEATCRSVMDRANLLPAIDGQGKPRATQARVAFDWKIPGPAENSHRVVFDDPSDGLRCYLRDEAVPRLLTPAFCEELANAVSHAGGALEGVIDTQLPEPIPYADPN